MNKLDQYHQRQEAIQIFGNGFVEGASIAVQLRLVALVARDICKMHGTELKSFLMKFCEDHIKDYNYRVYYRAIDAACRYANNKEHCLIEVDGIDVYKSEVEYIQSIGLTPKEEKVMFTIMMVKKLDRECFQQRHAGEEYSMLFLSVDEDKMKTIKRLTGITSRLNLPKDIFHSWNQKGIISVTNTGIILNFMKEMVEDGDIVLNVKHYDNFGIYWDCIAGSDKRGVCHCCYKPYKPANNKSIYCKECSAKHGRKGNELPPVKEITCDNCGQNFYVDARNAKTRICRKCKALMMKEEQ